MHIIDLFLITYPTWEMNVKYVFEFQVFQLSIKCWRSTLAIVDIVVNALAADHLGEEVEQEEEAFELQHGDKLRS